MVFWAGFWFTAGMASFLLLCRLAVIPIDWLDWLTSRMSETQARRRARRNMQGHWPRTAPFWTKPIDWLLLVTGFALMALSVLLYRHWWR